MPQVSRRYLSEDILEKIFSLFFDLIVEIDDKNQAEKILTELLTPTEKIMLAKRITCFYLLIKNIPLVEIADLIKLSTSTTTYFKHHLENAKELKQFLKRRISNEKLKKFFENIFIEFFYGMPQKGVNWTLNKKIYFRYQQRQKQPL